MCKKILECAFITAVTGVVLHSALTRHALAADTGSASSVLDSRMSALYLALPPYALTYYSGDSIKKDAVKEKVGEKREVKPIRRRKGDIGAGLKIPSRCGGQDLVRKQVRQRVHRTCHRCNTDFGAVKVCSKCLHNRCKKCPKDP